MLQSYRQNTITVYKCQYFIVATYFGLIRPSSCQRSEIWGTISAYHVLWDPILLTRCKQKRVWNYKSIYIKSG